MHEEALFRDLRRKLEEVAREEHVATISRVEVWVGALSHVSEDALRSHWDRTVEGTAARSAQLEVQVSRDVNDARATDLVLARVDVMDPDEGPANPGRRDRRPQEGDLP